jgi:phenylpropionate dioxygenase-like ring-hydroxylating dioxygenase large terminal subunit
VSRDRGLAQVAVAELGGLVFVQLDGALDVGYLGPLADELAGFGIPSGHVVCERVVERAMSWQLAIDVFLETYHLKTAHKASIYPLFFDNLGLVDVVGTHLRNVFPKRSIRELAGLPEDQWVLRHHANVLYHLFPNTLVLVEPDHSAVVQMWPLGPDRTRLSSYLVVPEAPATDKARAYWDANARVLYGAVDEDLELGCSIQRGLASGANREVMFGAFEHALAHFHRMLDACSTAPTISPR